MSIVTLSGDLVESEELYHTVGAGIVEVLAVETHPLPVRYKVYLRSLLRKDIDNLLQNRQFISYDQNGRFCTKEKIKDFPWHLTKKVVSSKQGTISKGLDRLNQYESVLCSKR